MDEEILIEWILTAVWWFRLLLENYIKTWLVYNCNEIYNGISKLQYGVNKYSVLPLIEQIRSLTFKNNVPFYESALKFQLVGDIEYFQHALCCKELFKI